MNNTTTHPLVAGKAPAETRVVVAMSGGVDSSVTAAILKEQGYDVIGVTLRLYDDAEKVMRTGTCCAGRDIRDAADVADKIGIPHHVLDLIDVFRRDVIEDFADTYARGETPIPCVNCNQTVKFRDLLAFAHDQGADALVTGHYARREDGPDGPQLLAGADAGRDQSYFLFATSKEELGFLHFPIGGWDKDATRTEAERLGLSVATKPDSQDICFVPDGNYARIVKRLRPDAFQAGDIVNEAGDVLGRHKGHANFTVGQRRGLGIGGGDALYVLRVEPETARVVVGPPESLLESRVPVRGLNWLGAGAGPSEGGTACTVKLRSAQAPVEATVFGLPGAAAEIQLAEPFAGVAPGQAAVFYDGDRVLGGGWITKS